MRFKSWIPKITIFLTTISGATFDRVIAKSEPLKVYLHLQGGEFFPKNGPWNPRAYPRVTIYNAVLGHLVMMKTDGSIEPGIIESWTTDSSGTLFKLHLRNGLHFHNGRPAKIEDLMFSLDRHLKSAIKTPERQNIEAIKEIKITGENELEVKLSTPNPNFIGRLSMSGLSLVPKEEIGPDLLGWKTHPIGVGPYKILSAQAEEILLEATNKYFNMRENAPQQIRLLSNLNAAPFDLALGLQKAPSEWNLDNFVLEIPGRIYTLVFNYRSTLGGNIDFRNAMALMIDRDALASKHPYTRSTTWLIPEKFISRNKAPVSVRDQNFARKTFEKLKVTEIVLPIYDSQEPLWVTELKLQFLAVGVTLQTEAAKTPLFDANNKDTPFWIFGWMPNVADPLVIYEIFRDGGAYVSNLGAEDKIYLDLLSDAQNEKDLKRREIIVQKLAQRFFELTRELPLFEEKLIYQGCKKKIMQIADPLQEQSILFHRIQLQP